jgi:hypothetical protein
VYVDFGHNPRLVRMAGIVMLKFVFDAVVKDRDLELRVVTVLGAVLGAISQLTRPQSRVDDIVVGAFLLSRLQPFKQHEAARVLQLMLLLVSVVVASTVHDLYVWQVVLLVAHLTFMATELFIRILKDATIIA